MASKFDPVQRLKDSEKQLTFKRLMANQDKVKLYYPLDTFCFVEYSRVVNLIQMELTDFSFNEIGYLVYFYYWLRENRQQE